MYKYFIGPIAFCLVLTAFNAFALEPLDSDTMKTTTAAAGVSIILDDIVIETWTSARSVTYTDSDGNGGSIRITSSANHNIITIQAITGYDPESGELKSPGTGLVRAKK